MQQEDTICAIATAQGGAIGIIRVSGINAIQYTSRIFHSASGKPLNEQKAYTLSFGQIINPNDAQQHVVDEVLVSVFRAPHSYTGEDSTEISCHGSRFILQSVIELLIQAGCRMAHPGEYTQRAFLGGKMDLSQAEAVADLIASSSAATHRMAMSQMRGDFSKQLSVLREKLLHLTALMELELDFSDHEELEFANRDELCSLTQKIEQVITYLTQSFKLGNALKQGIPVAIIGQTNAGKSTLLNTLLGEDKAIVSDIHGTTRDVIEDTMTIDTVTFRFIDTAGIRNTTDAIESLGIERSLQKMEQADIVLWVIDSKEAQKQIAALLPTIQSKTQQKKVIALLNKCDQATFPLHEIQEALSSLLSQTEIISISAKEGQGVEQLKNSLSRYVASLSASDNDIIVNNARHYEALTHALEAIKRVEHGLKNRISGDFVSQDLRGCLFHLAEITGGQIVTDEVLGTIFKNFCIGK